MRLNGTSQWFNLSIATHLRSTVWDAMRVNFWVATFLIDFWAAIRVTISAALPQHRR